MESSPPESGFRIEVARSPEADGPPWHYRGLAHTPSTTYDVTAIVNIDGTVSVELGAEAPPPHRIVRWHGDR